MRSFNAPSDCFQFYTITIYFIVLLTKVNMILKTLSQYRTTHEDETNYQQYSMFLIRRSLLILSLLLLTGPYACQYRFVDSNGIDKRVTHHDDIFVPRRHRHHHRDLQSSSKNSTNSSSYECFQSTEELIVAVNQYIASNGPDTPVAKLYGWPIGTWCVDDISDFTQIFYQKSTFNEDIQNWNVKKGIIFRQMFENATSFNMNLSNWDTSSAESMVRRSFVDVII
jgi:surface protein